MSKKEIETYMKEYLKKHNGTFPKGKEFNIKNGFPCSYNCMVELYGCYSNLKEKLGFDPIYKKSVKCKECGIKFEKSASQIKKTKNNFCSKSCAAKFNNSKRSYTNESKKKTSNSVKAYIIRKGGNLRPKTLCRACGKECSAYKNMQFCSVICKKWAYEHDIEYKREMLPKYLKASLASRKCWNPRSKNEIYFTKLCIKKYGKESISINKKIFDRGTLDADVILKLHIPLIKKKIRIAVEWNGPTHYIVIYKGQDLKSTQERDARKKEAIIKKGYLYHAVKDMGSHNKKFVKNEFRLFKKIVRLAEMSMLYSHLTGLRK